MGACVLRSNHYSFFFSFSFCSKLILVFLICSEMEVCAANHQFPFSKMLSFYRKAPFDLTASYSNPAMLPLKDGYIGRFLGAFVASNNWNTNLEPLLSHYDLYIR